MYSADYAFRLQLYRVSMYQLLSHHCHQILDINNLWEERFVYFATWFQWDFSLWL